MPRRRLSRILVLPRLLDRPAGAGRSTIDVASAAPAPSPLAPVDLTDDGEVTQVLNLAAGVGDLLLTAGTSIADTQIHIASVAGTYGLTTIHVEVTYNSLIVSAYRGERLPALSAMRVTPTITYDFERLAQTDQLLRRIRAGAIRPEVGLELLDEIRTMPRARPDWHRGLGWAILAAAVAALIGAGPLVMAVAFVVSMLVWKVNTWLDRAGLPLFYQQFAGGLIATIPAAVLYGLSQHLDFRIAPAQVIAAGIIMLLSGLSLYGSVADAITGAPITASARMFEVMLLTGGIIAGIAVALRAAELAGITVPEPVDHPAPALGHLPIAIGAGAAAGGAFAFACRAMPASVAITGLIGGMGSAVYLVLLAAGFGPVLSAGATSAAIGLVGGLLARRAVVPPLIIAVSGITPLLPGLSIYRGLYGLLNDQYLAGFAGLTTAIGIACSLAAGVVFGEWVARTLRRPQLVAHLGPLRKPQVVIRRRRPDPPVADLPATPRVDAKQPAPGAKRDAPERPASTE